MAKTVNFHEAIERDMIRLSAEVRERLEQPENKEIPAREVVKQSLEVFREKGAESESEAGTEETPRPSILPSYMANDSDAPQVQLEVEKLVDSIFHHGIMRALKESRKHPPFVQDAFHDALVDRLLPELKKRGVVS